MPMKKKRKRKTKLQRQIEDADKLAALVATSPIDGEAMPAPPALLRDPRLKPALAVWRELAPILAQRKVFEDTDRFQLALLCFWFAEFIVSANDILDRGYSVRVKTVSGDYMPRRNPAAGRRDHACEKISELSARFGLTPLDRFRLDRWRGSNKPGEGDLFTPADELVEDWPDVAPTVQRSRPN
jgi:P27 family predicted phage terminase small subunit